MEITQDSIKQWLGDHPERDRHWLAEQCDSDKRTVDNWLSSPRGVPAKAIIIIGNLMRADLEAEKAKLPAPPMNLTLEVNTEQFDRYSRAALKEGKIITEWILSVIDDAARRDTHRPPVHYPSVDRKTMLNDEYQPNSPHPPRA